FSIYAAMRKLTPGSWLRLDGALLQSKTAGQPQAYWSAEAVALEGVADPLAFESDSAAIDALEKVMGAAVQGQMLSDVPLGAFLSGGIDSSAVVALMQARGGGQVNTFSIGFDDPAFNEAEHAKAVAAHLGTSHTELYVSAQDALAVVPELAAMYDEPFADSSQIPTVLVARMARRHVTVALSGDGGDELFGGYSRYFRAQRWWDKRQTVPAMLRGPMALAARTGAGMMPMGRGRDQMLKLSEVLGAGHAGLFYRQFVSYWKQPAEALIGADLPQTPFDAPPRDPLFEHMMLLDAQTYLPDDILVKVYRAAMAASLETRVP